MQLAAATAGQWPCAAPAQRQPTLPSKAVSCVWGQQGRQWHGSCKHECWCQGGNNQQTAAGSSWLAAGRQQLGAHHDSHVGQRRGQHQKVVHVCTGCELESKAVALRSSPPALAPHAPLCTPTPRDSLGFCALSCIWCRSAGEGGRAAPPPAASPPPAAAAASPVDALLPCSAGAASCGSWQPSWASSASTSALRPSLASCSAFSCTPRPCSGSRNRRGRSSRRAWAAERRCMQQ